MYHDVIMAGFGGQGILMIGDVLALAAMDEGRHVTWMPTYGVEMRGGTARCTVVVSSERIGSPITETPCGVLVMNKPSLDRYETWIKPGGVLVANTTFIKDSDITRTDLRVLMLPCGDLAVEVGDARAASMIALGAYAEMAQVVQPEGLIKALEMTFTGRKQKLIPLNARALEAGREFAKKSGK